MPRSAQNVIPFTDRSLRALKPGERRADFLHPNLQGFGIRVFPSGQKRFFVRYARAGQERRYALGKFPALSLADARKAAEDILGRVARGEDPQGERRAQRTATTFGELAASYLATAQRDLRPTSFTKVEQAVRNDLKARSTDQRRNWQSFTTGLGSKHRGQGAPAIG